MISTGATTSDEAAVVRVAPDALAGWDRHDASKLTPPSPVFALLAPVLERGGAPYRAAVSTLPDALDAPAVIPVAFRATDAGTYTVTWTGTLPDGWSASLRDTETGVVTAVTAGASYAFASGATDWAERFELVVTPAGVVAAAGAPAAAATLDAVRPNPTAGVAHARLTTAEAGPVRAVVVDALGREVRVVLDGPAASGADLVVDTDGLAPGAYVLRVTAAGTTLVRPLTVVR